MFVWEWWKEMYASSLEMAAQTTLSALGGVAGTHGEDAEPLYDTSHKRLSPADENDQLLTLGEISFCSLNHKGEGMAFGSNWEEMTGLETDHCKGPLFADYFHPQHRQLLFRKLQELHASLKGRSNDEPIQPLRFRAQYGSTHVGYRWYEFSLAPRLAAGESRAPVIAVVMRYIGREMETERVLRTARIETELAHRARAEFLGHMSHELRTPLNAILGFAEMIEMGIHGEIKDKQYRDYLGNIRESGHMLLGRINDMLEVASIEVGDTDIHDHRFSPEELAELAMKLHRHDSFCRRITLKMTKTWPRVMIKCDQAKITRALGNILANAIRFSPSGSEVVMDCYIGKQGRLIFAVYDHGDGISADHLAQLQDALHKKSSMFSSCPEKVCLGLGLAVAKEFACLHGGRLDIDSEKGKGTQARLCLPAERVISLETPNRRRRKKEVAVMS